MFESRNVRATGLALAFATSAGALTGCASSPQPPQPPVIQITPALGDAYWHVTWHLAEPAHEIEFERPGAQFRGEAFEVLTPGWSVERRDEGEVLRSAGDASASVSVRFRPFDRELPKEYEFFQKFTDGSLAMYTGHLVARPTSEPDCEDCHIRRFRIEGTGGTPVVLDGRKIATPLEWRDETGQGAYVYYGGIAPVESDAVISVLDPGLPDWLAREFASALPKLFSLYETRFGVPPPQRPTVLFNYVPDDTPGYSSGGGTLPGLIQLKVQGDAWNEPSDEAVRQLMHFLAHEAIHVWNGEVVRYPGSEDAWMHEGAADALAQRTLMQLGLIDEARFRAYQTEALNSCRKGLGDFPLREAAGRRQFALYYSCGNVLGLLTERSIDGDLFGFWERLIAGSLDTRTYDANAYFETLRELGASESRVEAIRRFVEERADPEALVAMLRDAGVDVSTAATPPESYGQSVSRDALLSLLADRCSGRYGYRVTHDGFLLDDPLDCEGLPAGATVTHLGGFDVLREGHRTWETLSAGCGTGGSVEVTFVGEEGNMRTLELECRTPVRALPAYVTLE